MIDEDYSTAASYTSKIAKQVLNNPTKFPQGTILNVNVPSVAANEIKGVKLTRLGFRQYEKYF